MAKTAQTYTELFKTDGRGCVEELTPELKELVRETLKIHATAVSDGSSNFWGTGDRAPAELDDVYQIRVTVVKRHDIAIVAEPCLLCGPPVGLELIVTNNDTYRYPRMTPTDFAVTPEGQALIAIVKQSVKF